MELKVYLQVILKKWWVVIPTFLVTLTTGIVLTYTATPQYTATAIYVVVPSSSFGDVKSFAGGLDMLGRREEIATTFSEIATSRRIKKLALNSISRESGFGYSVSSLLREGTNIIEVKVEGPDPVVVRDLANAIGQATEEFVQGMYEVFRLSLLDEAGLPGNPSSPRKSLNLTLAAVLGLALGAGLAFLAEYLETPIRSTVGVSIIDERTGIYNKGYLLHRLSEEMIRARRNRYPLSLALIRFSNLDLLEGSDSTRVRAELLHQAAMVINQSLREEDIVAPFEDNIFAILLPDMTGENAQATMEYIQTLVAWTPFQSPNSKKFSLKGVAGIVTYDYNGTTRDELVAKATQALQLAEVGGNGKTYLMSELMADNHDK